MPLPDYLVLFKVQYDDIINSNEVSSAAAYTLAITQARLDCIPQAEEQAAAGYDDKEDGGNRGQDLDGSIEPCSLSLNQDRLLLHSHIQALFLHAQYLLLSSKALPRS